jgi:TonB family protein
MHVCLRRLQLVCLFFPILFATPCWSQSDSANERNLKIIGLLRAHLHVPRALSDRTGEAWVDVTIDRSGSVKSTKLVKNTGVPGLDAAVLAAIEAAQPFPVPPGADDSALKMPLAFGFPSRTTVDDNEEKLKARLRGICRGC